jgi:signal transduction histidine kinase
MSEHGAGAGFGPAASRPPASSSPARVPVGGLRRAVRPIVSASTWLAVIHLLAGLVTGIVIFVLVLTFTVTGIATVWFFLAGLPVLAAMLWLCLQFGRAERARFAAVLGVAIPAPPPTPRPVTSWWRRVWPMLAAPATRRQFGYAVLRFPLSLAEAVLVTAIWSVALALLGLPLLGWLMLKVSWHVDRAVPLGPPALAASCLLGLVLLLAAPWVTQGLTAADIAIARSLLGPGRAELSARIGELEVSRARVVDSAEAERRRIERDLHDGAQQRLVSLAMNLGRAKARFAEDPDAARDIIDQAHAEAKQALTELRNLVRGVHPPVLADRGLDAAISGLAALSPVPVQVHIDLPARPPAPVEAIAYFVVAEALTNVAKHAHATQVEVSVGRRGDVLDVLVRDDGQGGADPHGQGLAGLADRVAGVDGQLSVRSPAGGPTVIEVELPCGS